MPDVYYADQFAWAATPEQVNETAVSLFGAGCNAVGTDDPADVGGRPLHFPAGRGARFSCKDPGDNYTIHFFARGSGGATTAARILVLTDATNSFTFNCHRPFGSTPNIQFRLGTTVLYTALSISEWSHYRVQIFEHASLGTIRIFRDGEEVFFGDELDTSRAWEVDRIGLGAQNGGGTQFFFTHVIVCEQDLGSGAVVQYFPVTSDEGPNEMTRNDGATDFGVLDDVPTDGDTSYVRSENENDRTTHKATVSGLGGRVIIAAQAHSTQRLELASDDRLAYRLGGRQAIDGNISDSEYVARGGDWYDVDVSDDPYTEASLSDEVLQIEHLAPAE